MPAIVRHGGFAVLTTQACHTLHPRDPVTLSLRDGAAWLREPNSVRLGPRGENAYSIREA